MDILALLLGLVLGLVVGGAAAGMTVATLLRRRPATDSGVGAIDPAVLQARHATELAEVRAAEAAVQAEIRTDLASAHTRVDALQEQLRDAQQQYRELVERQRAEAQERAERERKEAQERAERERAEAQERAQRERAESKVLEALAPVKQTLTEMQRKVVELETQRHEQHGQLTQQLRTAAESEERLRSTAEALASALRSNSTRGVWGETQLRSVVEAAGLIERVDFSVQSRIQSDAGSGRPDMIVHLPGGKSIALDAKVPFNSYLEASQIPATATGAEGARREALMKQHVKAVRDHITTLGTKAYWTGLESSPELVIAFIPSESLVSSALEADPSIMEFAFGKRVALASPVTLWSVLKTVAFSWQQDVLTQEAKQLFDLSRTLYTRLSTTAGHIEKLGRSLERTIKDYNGFVGSLERQVFPAARKLNALDESKVIGVIEGIEEAPRELTAFELVSELEAIEQASAADDSAEAADRSGTGEERDMHGIDKLALEEQARAHETAARAAADDLRSA